MIHTSVYEFDWNSVKLIKNKIWTLKLIKRINWPTQWQINQSSVHNHDLTPHFKVKHCVQGLRATKQITTHTHTFEWRNSSPKMAVENWQPNGFEKKKAWRRDDDDDHNLKWNHQLISPGMRKYGRRKRKKPQKKDKKAFRILGFVRNTIISFLI